MKRKPKPKPRPPKPYPTNDAIDFAIADKAYMAYLKNPVTISLDELIKRQSATELKEKIIPFSELPDGFVENLIRRIGIMQLGSDYSPERLIDMLNEDQRKELLEALQKVVKNAGNTRTSSKPTEE